MAISIKEEKKLINQGVIVGTCKNCTGTLKEDWLSNELFHAETGMKNCPFSNDIAQLKEGENESTKKDKEKN